ncbi:hypothetical protein CFC21_024649 [Triticum aestivum]|uniref:Uncharacterized protein n=2 Tax=Triticum aestivum TaxID=4565 RepID=A0A9R1EGS1_WHEAT|nr:hypothetical protein CFC21_024645 [Triticum aestivum]KAF7010203.1 hypothetical protein CFC21_024649 [Triticum aestivum]
MGFFNGKTKQTTTQKPERRVKVRVEPPGYSHHEFELPASHLRSRHFASLMAKAKKEDGVEGKVVAIQCGLEDFLLAMVKTISRAPFDSSPRCPILGWFSARSR